MPLSLLYSSLTRYWPLAVCGEFNLASEFCADSKLKAHVKMIQDITSARKRGSMFTETCERPASS